MPIHIFVNRTNFIPYHGLYAVEFYIIFGRNFHWLFHFIWICFWFYFDFSIIFWFSFEFQYYFWFLNLISDFLLIFLFDFWITFDFIFRILHCLFLLLVYLCFHCHAECPGRLQNTGYLPRKITEDTRTCDLSCDVIRYSLAQPSIAYDVINTA